MSIIKRHDDPYAAGWAAHQRVEPLDSNPYPLLPDIAHEHGQWQLWALGWLEAEKLSAARRAQA